MLGINNQNITNANIPNLNTNLINSITAAQKQPIGLTQFKDLDMPQSFTDDNGTKWKLAKSSKDSSVEIPDPAMVTLTRWWNHVHPLSNGKVYIYVVEGIKRPRIELLIVLISLRTTLLPLNGIMPMFILQILLIAELVN